MLNMISVQRGLLLFLSKWPTTETLIELETVELGYQSFIKIKFLVGMCFSLLFVFEHFILQFSRVKAIWPMKYFSIAFNSSAFAGKIKINYGLKLKWWN